MFSSFVNFVSRVFFTRLYQGVASYYRFLDYDSKTVNIHCGRIVSVYHPLRGGIFQGHDMSVGSGILEQSLQLLGNALINEVELKPVVFQPLQDVFRLDIPVDDVLAPHLDQRGQQLVHKSSDGLGAERPPAPEAVQVPRCEGHLQHSLATGLPHFLQFAESIPTLHGQIHVLFLPLTGFI